MKILFFYNGIILSSILRYSKPNSFFCTACHTNHKSSRLTKSLYALTTQGSLLRYNAAKGLGQQKAQSLKANTEGCLLGDIGAMVN